MRPELASLGKLLSSLLSWLRRAFDRTATWVVGLSWWKFILFAVLTLMAGSLLQEALFTPEGLIVVRKDKDKGSKSEKGAKSPDDIEAEVRIDGTGIHIRNSRKDGAKAAADRAAASADAAKAAADAAEAEAEEKKENAKKDEDEIHVPLPPHIGSTITPEDNAAIEEAVQDAVKDATDAQAEVYRKKSSAWFMNFILLVLVFLFGTKALMGGKKRAEARAASASETAEREALQRQVVEARMQMMQAQVEPHFLFNTLGSVEHLIETDPPRAAAMQRTLIQYLRAVLPQMREPETTTRLGREADIVRAYLDLLKMRMEERLTVDLQVPAELRDAPFPPMMLQSLVENAIKHGLEAKPDGGTLRVLAEVMGDKLRVTVADNGLGFGAIKSNGTGLGLQNIRERLKLLFGDKAQLIIVPNSPSGVSVTIEIPYQQN